MNSRREPVQLAFDLLFDAMIARSELLRFGDLELALVRRDDLLAVKRRAAADPGRRSKALPDQADIALLQGQVPIAGQRENPPATSPRRALGL